MAVVGAQVTVTTSAVRLDSDGSNNIQGHRVVVKNTDATNPVFLGASGVTTGTGFSLAAGATVDLPLSDGEQIFAISAGSVVVHVLRVG